MNAVSNYSYYSNNHTRSITSLPNRASRHQLHASSLKNRSTKEARAFLPIKNIRIYMICAAMLLCFFMGIVVHIITGSDEVQAASVQTATIATTSATTMSASPVSVQPEKQQIIVGIGDTLWSIADSHAPKGQDIRTYIQKVKQANHLSSSALRAGQVLVLP